MILYGSQRKTNGKPAARLHLEQLEDRLTPAAIDTVTNVAININPTLATHTATETITATVTQAGSTTPVTTGSVVFNVNGQTGDAGLNSQGQATFVVKLPLYAVETNQALVAVYTGGSDTTDTFNNSAFLSPVYLNVLNGLFSSNISFVGPPLSQSTLPFDHLGTYNGETNSVAFFAPITFNYGDPGTIDNFTLLGFTLDGSLSGNLLAPFESYAASLNNQLL